MSKIAFQRAFQELSDDEIKAVMNNAHLLDFAPDSVLIREGNAQDKIMVIMEGKVRVVRFGPQGEEVPLTDPLGPGDTVGEMSFIDHMGASATLVADTPVKVKAIDQDLVASMAAADPTFLGRFYHSLLFTVIRRLRVLDFKISYPA